MSSHELWATDIRHLNDATEFQYALDLATRRLDELSDDIGRQAGDDVLGEWRRGIQLAKYPRIYVTSFCEDGDLLSQWRGYAAGGGIRWGSPRSC